MISGKGSKVGLCDTVQDLPTKASPGQIRSHHKAPRANTSTVQNDDITPHTLNTITPQRHQNWSAVAPLTACSTVSAAAPDPVHHARVPTRLRRPSHPAAHHCSSGGRVVCPRGHTNTHTHTHTHARSTKAHQSTHQVTSIHAASRKASPRTSRRP